MFDPSGVILDPKLLDLARVLSRRRKFGKAGRQKSLVTNQVRRSGRRQRRPALVVAGASSSTPAPAPSSRPQTVTFLLVVWPTRISHFAPSAVIGTLSVAAESGALRKADAAKGEGDESRGGCDAPRGGALPACEEGTCAPHARRQGAPLPCRRLQLPLRLTESNS